MGCEPGGRLAVPIMPLFPSQCTLTSSQLERQFTPKTSQVIGIDSPIARSAKSIKHEEIQNELWETRSLPAKSDFLSYYGDEPLTRGEVIVHHRYPPETCYSSSGIDFQEQEHVTSSKDWRSPRSSLDNKQRLDIPIFEQDIPYTNSAYAYKQCTYTDSNDNLENTISSHCFSAAKQGDMETEANNSDHFSSDIEDADFLEAIHGQTEAYNFCPGELTTDAAPVMGATDEVKHELKLHESAEMVYMELKEYFTDDSDELSLDADITPSQLISAEGSGEVTYDDNCSQYADAAIFDDQFQDAPTFGHLQDYQAGCPPKYGQYESSEIKHDTISEGNTTFYSNNDSNGPMASQDDSMTENKPAGETDRVDLVRHGPLPKYKQPFQFPGKCNGSPVSNAKLGPFPGPQDEVRELRQPFLRPPFPCPVPIGSPIQGLTSAHTILRTCFRIGEALKVHFTRPSSSPLCPRSTSELMEKRSQKANMSASIPSTAFMLIELYAFVTESYRIRNKQFFKFADLFFPFQPPYLSGVWECWEGNPLYDEDGRRFLGPCGRQWRRGINVPPIQLVHADSANDFNDDAAGQGSAGRLCRVIGSLKSRDHALQVKPDELLPGSVLPFMEIYSIWHATWEDVDYVKGIVQE
ncbi:hypothetical protein DTO271D3_776 [Paecilomyces variotii]|nr:hypothetical protein DTO271D3_776 [Paecilomyces variotii]